METETPVETEAKTVLLPAEPWDAYAWGDLVRHYGPRLRTRLGRMLRRSGWVDRTDRVEDLLQEVYCRLLAAGCRRLGAFRGGSPAELDSYLGRVAERVALDAVRAARAQKRDGRRLVRAGRSDPDGLDRVVDAQGTPLDRLLVRERGWQLAATCRRLVGPGTSRRDARIAHLALVEGWTSREIAGAMGGRLAASSIDSLIHRLRRRLAAEGIELPSRQHPARRLCRRGSARRRRRPRG